jgi:dihydroflavonol-4-reductase
VSNEPTSTDLELRPQRVLVTGATGFLGHHLVDALVQRGYEVLALVRDPNARAAKRLHPLAKRVEGDVLDADSVSAAALGCVGVFHCAGMVSRDSEDALRMHDVNVRGTEITLDAARKAGVRRVVHASTSGTIAISKDDRHGTETDERPFALINRWPYYRTKYYAELAALERNRDGLEVVLVNPSLLLGPGDLHGSSTTDVRRALENPMAVAPAGGVSFVDARDAAIGMILAYEKGRPGRTYLLTACNCSTHVFLSRVARLAGHREPVLELPNKPWISKLTAWVTEKAADILGDDDAFPDPVSLEMAQHYWYCDATRAETELGWTFRDPMETLSDTILDLRERGIVMSSAPK